jgi:hypothetical protein
VRKKLVFLTLALAIAAVSGLQTPAFAVPQCPIGTVACSCDGDSFTCLPPAVCAHVLCSQ